MTLVVELLRARLEGARAVNGLSADYCSGYTGALCDAIGVIEDAVHGPQELLPASPPAMPVVLPPNSHSDLDAAIGGGPLGEAAAAEVPPDMVVLPDVDGDDQVSIDGEPLVITTDNVEQVLVWSPDREAELAAAVTIRNADWQDIWATLNAMPALPISSPGAVKAKASKMKLQRPDRVPAAAAAAAAVAPPAPGRTAVEQEIFDLFAAGVGVRSIAADFDMDLGHVSNLKARWQALQAEGMRS